MVETLARKAANPLTQKTHPVSNNRPGICLSKADTPRKSPSSVAAYSLHCSSFLGLPFGILNIELVRPKKELQWRLYP